MIDNNTQFFKTQPDKAISVEGILEQVYRALKEKGYNPVNQIVGYIMSGDPTYITSHNNARSLIMIHCSVDSESFKKSTGFKCRISAMIHADIVATRISIKA